MATHRRPLASRATTAAQLHLRRRLPKRAAGASLTAATLQAKLARLWEQCACACTAQAGPEARPAELEICSRHRQRCPLLRARLQQTLLHLMLRPTHRRWTPTSPLRSSNGARQVHNHAHHPAARRSLVTRFRTNVLQSLITLHRQSPRPQELFVDAEELALPPPSLLSCLGHPIRGGWRSNPMRGDSCAVELRLRVAHGTDRATGQHS